MQPEAVETLAPAVRLAEFAVADGHAWAAAAIPLPTAVEQWPGLPAAGLPEGGRIANGRGLTREASRLSCLGELAELWSACDWGDAPVISATARALGPRALPVAAVTGFSAAQLAERSRWNADWRGLDWRPPPVPDDREIDWLPVRALTGGEDAYAPADALLIGRREAGDEGAAAVADSNGCAAGPDPDSALLAALLELIERDAAALWWYAGRPAPCCAAEAWVDDAGLARFLAGRPRRTGLYDITSDLGIPVMAAVSSEADGRDVAIGFAAALHPRRAAESAVTELLQMELSLEQARALGPAAGPWHLWRSQVDMGTAPLSRGVDGGGPTSAAKGAGGLGHLMDACRARGIAIHVLELTRPELGIPAVRALSPDLCPLKPRFGRRRLLAAAGSEAALARVFPFCV